MTKPVDYYQNKAAEEGRAPTCIFCPNPTIQSRHICDQCIEDGGPVEYYQPVSEAQEIRAGLREIAYAILGLGIIYPITTSLLDALWMVVRGQ